MQIVESRNIGGSHGSDGRIFEVHFFGREEGT